MVFPPQIQMLKAPTNILGVITMNLLSFAPYWFGLCLMNSQICYCFNYTKAHSKF